MNKHAGVILDRLMTSYPKLEVLRKDMEKAHDLLIKCYANNGKVLVCGNGGSASDSEHIVGELMKGFMLKRPLKTQDIDRINNSFPEDAQYLASNLQGALPAISLVSHSALSTAFINDVAPDMVFAQQVYGYGKPGDVLIGLSTSGNSANVVNAVKVAKAFGLNSICLTGESGGKLSCLCDVAIKVPARETYMVQEYHLPVYHALCAMIEAEFFSG